MLAKTELFICNLL